jgi:hypothetical protein
LTINSFNCIIIKIIKIWYFKNTYRDKSNNDLYANIFLFISKKIRSKQRI